MHDKKNLLKLLPAAAVIAAVAVTAVQGKATDGIQKEPENTEVRDAGELSGLLKTAYFDEDTSADSGTKEIAKAKKKKAKKSGNAALFCCIVWGFSPHMETALAGSGQCRIRLGCEKDWAASVCAKAARPRAGNPQS